MQNRWKSPVLWSALSALLLFILKNYGLLALIGLNSDTYNQLANLVLALLLAVGIINNPENKGGI